MENFHGPMIIKKAGHIIYIAALFKIDVPCSRLTRVDFGWYIYPYSFLQTSLSLLQFSFFDQFERHGGYGSSYPQRSSSKKWLSSKKGVYRYDLSGRRHTVFVECWSIEQIDGVFERALSPLTDSALNPFSDHAGRRECVPNQVPVWICWRW